MGKRKKNNDKPQVNQDLDGFDIKINEFGEINSTYNVGKLNKFLDDNTNDKKFRGVEVIRKKGDKKKEDTDKNWS